MSDSGWIFLLLIIFVYATFSLDFDVEIFKIAIITAQPFSSLRAFGFRAKVYTCTHRKKKKRNDAIMENLSRNGNSRAYFHRISFKLTEAAFWFQNGGSKKTESEKILLSFHTTTSFTCSARWSRKRGSGNPRCFSLASLLPLSLPFPSLRSHSLPVVSVISPRAHWVTRPDLFPRNLFYQRLILGLLFSMLPRKYTKS